MTLTNDVQENHLNFFQKNIKFIFPAVIFIILFVFLFGPGSRPKRQR